MNETQKSPSPTLEIKKTLDDLDALAREDNNPDYRHILLSRLGSIFETHPDLRNVPNPVVIRAMGLLAREDKARAEEVLYRTKTLDQIAPVTKGDLYERLSDASKEAVDQFMLDLLDGDTKSTPLEGPEHLAELTNISLEDARGAYGVLDGIEAQPGVVTYSLFDLQPTPAGEGTRSLNPEGSDPRESVPYVLSDFYIARTQQDEAGHIISIVLETIPYVPSNAVYVLRNDEGHWQSGIKGITNKRDTRGRGAVRRVYHTKDEQGNIDNEGVTRRINKLLAMPFDKFNK